MDLAKLYKRVVRLDVHQIGPCAMWHGNASN